MVRVSMVWFAPPVPTGRLILKSAILPASLVVDA